MGSSINPNATPAGVPSGSECLSVTVNAGTATKGKTTTEMATTTSFLHCYFQLAAEDISVNDTFMFQALRDASDNLVAYWEVEKTGESTYTLDFKYYSGGAVHGLSSPISITTGAWYELEFKYKPADLTWEAWKDGATVESGSLSSTTRTPNQLDIGILECSETDAGAGDTTIYLDLVKWSIDKMHMALILGVNDISQTQAIDATNPIQILSVNSIDQAQAMDSPAVVQSYVLAINDISQGQTMDALGSLSLTHLLVVNDISQAQAIDSTIVSPILSVAGISQGQVMDNVSMTQAGVLAVNDISQGQEFPASLSWPFASMSLTQHNVLEVQGVTQGQTLDQVSVSIAVYLVVADISQTQGIDGPALVQQNTLVVADISQGQTLDALGSMVEATTLVVADISQGQTLDSIVLDLATWLAVNNISQGQALDATDLVQAHVLDMDDISQAQTLDAVGIYLLMEEGVINFWGAGKTFHFVGGSRPYHFQTKGKTIHFISKKGGSE